MKVNDFVSVKCDKLMSYYPCQIRAIKPYYNGFLYYVCSELKCMWLKKSEIEVLKDVKI